MKSGNCVTADVCFFFIFIFHSADGGRLVGGAGGGASTIGWIFDCHMKKKMICVLLCVWVDLLSIELHYQQSRDLPSPTGGTWVECTAFHRIKLTLIAGNDIR